ncbi:MAG UNVERIFIED_CONTAM: hypothetical protein LVR29_03020 [Microcystis novacekii LVE1205-3]|jgi:3-oxoacyl-(acyl-carrier-protein) synthase
MKVYDRRASGFIPGEGCGFVVLKRLADAQGNGDYIYALLDGLGDCPLTAKEALPHPLSWDSPKPY